jgi:hypothetical protein
VATFISTLMALMEAHEHLSGDGVDEIIAMAKDIV